MIVSWYDSIYDGVFCIAEWTDNKHAACMLSAINDNEFCRNHTWLVIIAMIHVNTCVSPFVHARTNFRAKLQQAYV